MLRLALLVLPLWMTACTTVQQSADGQQARAAAEPADPDRRARVHLELAGLYFERGQHQTALDEIKAVLVARPDLPEALGLRALIYAGMGDAVRAEESFQRALQLAPADGAMLHNHAWFLCQQRRYAEADAQFERALAQPQYRDTARTYFAQGVCLARGGQWTQAERALSRAYELDPANPAVGYNLAEVLLRRGELDRARFYVQRVNAVPAQVTAQSLWLAARIERRLGNLDAVRDYGRQLHARFPQANETQDFERGRFDD
jgi:type IV pilus assembly protein PilF